MFYGVLCDVALRGEVVTDCGALCVVYAGMAYDVVVFCDGGHHRHK
jgi:hypothetical protein